MSRKVTCSSCLNEEGGVCSVKKESVKANKRRICGVYKEDSSKITEKPSIETVLRPPWYWTSKSDLKKIIKQAKREEEMRGQVYGSHKRFDVNDFTSTAQ